MVEHIPVMILMQPCGMKKCADKVWDDKNHFNHWLNSHHVVKHTLELVMHVSAIILASMKPAYCNSESDGEERAKRFTRENN